MSHSGRPVHEVKANLFRVLGHPARVRILELLRDGERSVGALQAELGLDSGGTSQHLAALRRIGLVESRREGTSVYYRVDDERVFDLLEAGRGDHHAAALRAAVDPERARELVIGVLLVAALSAVAIGAVLALGRRTFEARPHRAGGGGGGSRGRRLLGARVRRHARGGVHELVRSALRRRRPERALPRHARR